MLQTAREGHKDASARPSLGPTGSARELSKRPTRSSHLTKKPTRSPRRRHCTRARPNESRTGAPRPWGALSIQAPESESSVIPSHFLGPSEMAAALHKKGNGLLTLGEAMELEGSDSISVGEKSAISIANGRSLPPIPEVCTEAGSAYGRESEGEASSSPEAGEAKALYCAREKGNAEDFACYADEILAHMFQLEQRACPPCG